MAAPQTKLQSQIIGLSSEAFEAFCGDISGMFGEEMKCVQQEYCTDSVDGLKIRLGDLVAVNTIKAEGVLDGNFHVIFDKDGLFTLSGVILMLPEQRILLNKKEGTSKEAEDMDDAISEAGNLLVGAWD